MPHSSTPGTRPLEPVGFGLGGTIAIVLAVWWAFVCPILAPALGAQTKGDEKEREKTSEAEMTGPDETVSVDAQTADPRIRRRLGRIFDSAERFRGLTVEVRDGIVFLDGRTTSERNKTWATEVARKTEGVVAVLNDIEVEASPVSWWRILSHLLHMAIAYVLALPIAWNREQASRSAGLRTFPLVSVASCGFMLIGLFALEAPDAQARIMYGIMTGIGFIGGGAILKDKAGVQGTATAASIWNTAAIGVAVAWRHFEIAVVLSALNFATLRIGENLKSRVKNGEEEPDPRGENDERAD